MWSHSPSPLDSIRDAVLTVSPNKQYLGIFSPTTPAQTGPVKHQSSQILKSEPKTIKSAELEKNPSKIRCSKVQRQLNSNLLELNYCTKAKCQPAHAAEFVTHVKFVNINRAKMSKHSLNNCIGSLLEMTTTV